MLRAAKPPPARVLDFGCGRGGFLQAAAMAGYDVRGVELAPSSILNLRRVTGLRVEPLAEAGGGFDVIHIADVLEHLRAPATLLSELESRLAPGGQFFVEGPVESQPSLVRSVASLIGAGRRRFTPHHVSSHAPLRLTMTTAASQRRFFEDRMGYDITHFEICETGWPYRFENRAPRGLAQRLRHAVGVTAVHVASLGRHLPAPLRLGNRFVALCAPRSKEAALSRALR